MYTIGQKSLRHIYDMSLNSDVFLNESKIAKVKPVCKKRDKYDTQNYRPISVLSIFYKILVSLMFNRLIHFLSINRILTEAQNGLGREMY